MKPPLCGSHRLTGPGLERLLRIAYAVLKLFWIMVLISRL